MQGKIFRANRKSEAGMTLIELMIASAVLVFGMLSVMGLLMLAIGNNGRSKVDSTATMLTQGVLEQVSAKLAGGGPGSITDNANCNGTGTAWTIDSAPGNGAKVAAGKIDFTQAQNAVPANYFMNYVDCNNNVQAIYDVRWNVQTIGANGTYLVTVGARPKGNLPTRFSFAIPVTMRAYVGTN